MDKKCATRPTKVLNEEEYIRVQVASIGGDKYKKLYIMI